MQKKYTSAPMTNWRKSGLVFAQSNTKMLVFLRKMLKMTNFCKKKGSTCLVLVAVDLTKKKIF